MAQTIAKHSRLPRKSANTNKTQLADTMTPKPPQPMDNKPIAAQEITPERKALILKQAKTLLLAGHTLKEIAEATGVRDKALRMWILGAQDDDLLNVWVDSGLVEVDDILENLDETDINAHIKLAKVRELLRSKQWYAQRRSRERYGDEKFPVATVVPILQIICAQESFPTANVIEIKPAALPAPTETPTTKGA